ncbi:hypothetical protein H0H87_005489, partial [Tephrocybe sp. NHM501043]
MAPKPLDVLKKGLKKLREEANTRKTQLQEWLAERKSIHQKTKNGWISKEIWWTSWQLWTPGNSFGLMNNGGDSDDISDDAA